MLWDAVWFCGWLHCPRASPQATLGAAHHQRQQLDGLPQLLVPGWARGCWWTLPAHPQSADPVILCTHRKENERVGAGSAQGARGVLWLLQLKSPLFQAVALLVGGEENPNSKIKPRRAHQETKNLPIFTLSRLSNNTRLLIWLLSLH